MFSYLCCILHLISTILIIVCGMNFYRLENNRCSRCPENSIRQLNDSESMCNCLSGYMRQAPEEIGQPCLRKYNIESTQNEPPMQFLYLSLFFNFTSLTPQENSSSPFSVETITLFPLSYSATLGFSNNAVTFSEMDQTHTVFIPLILSAKSSQNISLTFTINPPTYMRLVRATTIYAGTTMQV